MSKEQAPVLLTSVDDPALVRAWALHLACTAPDLRFGGLEVAAVANEFAEFVLHGTIPVRARRPPRKSLFG
jgi:hypothetical protein